ncbi:uncharacterized protein [Pseudorca crassidens]|uniref:uncharacterized protein n=1 Tax=Pseudorca crassidens TaxID=82174 RepID=UPI00352DE072
MFRPGSGSSSGGSFRSGGPTAAVAAAPPPLRGSVPSPHTQTRRTAAAGGAVWALLPPPPQEHPARGDRKEALALSSVLVLLLLLPPPPGITRAPPSQAAALVAMMMMSRTQPLGEGRRGVVCAAKRGLSAGGSALCSFTLGPRLPGESPSGAWPVSVGEGEDRVVNCALAYARKGHTTLLLTWHWTKSVRWLHPTSKGGGSH